MVRLVRTGPGASGSTQRPGLPGQSGKSTIRTAGNSVHLAVATCYLLPRCSCSALLQRATLLLALPRPLGHRHSILQGLLLPAGPGATYCMLLQVCIYRQHPNLLQTTPGQPNSVTSDGTRGKRNTRAVTACEAKTNADDSNEQRRTTTTTRIPGRAALRGPPSPGSPRSHFSPFVSPAHVFAPGSRPGTPSDRRRVD